MTFVAVHTDGRVQWTQDTITNILLQTVALSNDNYLL